MVNVKAEEGAEEIEVAEEVKTTIDKDEAMQVDMDEEMSCGQMDRFSIYQQLS